MCTVQEDQCALMISHSVVLEMRNVSKFVGKIKTRISSSITFLSENLAVYQIMWVNMIEPDRP
jgi:hypothetical protein